MTENTLKTKQNILVFIDEQLKQFLPKFEKEINELKNTFCGTVCSKLEELEEFVVDKNSIIYVCGNIEENYKILKDNPNFSNAAFYNIEELSYKFSECKANFVSIRSLPLNIHNVGVYIRQFFDETEYDTEEGPKNYFDLLSNEHQFQELTESNKPTNSYRKGIYITDVHKTGLSGEDLGFNLLRCSTNLDGPTDNFQKTDKEIVGSVNEISKYFFEQDVELNHVLAQIYNNVTVDNKERKAKIKRHSDKTKDMPRNALMAFCTFYKFTEEQLKNIKISHNDYCHKTKGSPSVLTKLRFDLKNKEENKEGLNLKSGLVEKFDIVLYPNSVFIMSLAANRLYTHEIVPSYLAIEDIPTRMGYVIRCSNTKAVYKTTGEEGPEAPEGQVYIDYDADGLVKLEKPTDEDVEKLKALYYLENSTTEIVEYGPINYSLNNGDYRAPLL